MRFAPHCFCGRIITEHYEAKEREIAMTRLTILTVVLTSLYLVGCEEGPADRAADSIRDQTQTEADQVRDTTQEQAEKIRDQTGRDSFGNAATDPAERTADQIEKSGERQADLIEKEGERKADATEDAPKNP
jgi:outer membrane murein-binding lipoprotein Lpp